MMFPHEMTRGIFSYGCTSHRDAIASMSIAAGMAMMASKTALLGCQQTVQVEP